MGSLLLLGATKMPVTAKLPPAQQYERKKVSLFLFTAFADEISAAEGCEHCYACADRTLIAVLVVRHSVVG